MKFTVVKIFNPEAVGLPAPHFAVLATLPADLGGEQRVIDVLPVASEKTPADILEGYQAAFESMPYRTNDAGGEIDFMGRDFNGAVRKQNTMYLPAASATGKTFPESLIDWMCWRARVHLWVSQQDRVALPVQDEQRLLRTLVEPQLQRDYVAPRAAPSVPGDEVVRPARRALTMSAAPL